MIRNAGDKIRAMFGTRPQTERQRAVIQQDDTLGPVDRLVWDLSEIGIGCVVYTGARIAVTDTDGMDYGIAVTIARNTATLRGVAVTVLDAPL